LEEYTALSIAASCGQEVAVQLLLRAGAQVNKVDYAGRSPLYSAAADHGSADANWGGDHTAVVELLLDAGADANWRVEDGSTPLMVAAQEGHETVVAALLRPGTRVDQTRGEPYTQKYIP
jgi:ankyrin repeat protein